MFCSLKNTIFSPQRYSVLSLHATGCSLWGKKGRWEPGLGENRGQEGYGRWERKEQEVAGKSGLEVGEKGESTQHCLLLCHQKRRRKGNKLRKKGQGRDARYIRYILRSLDPPDPYSAFKEKISCSYCHYLIICRH